MLSLSDIKMLLNPQKYVEPEDDFRVLRTWSVYDDSKKHMRYMCFEIETIDPESGKKYRLFKALRFVRVIRIPKSAKQSTSFMDMQAQVLAGVHDKNINLITLIANVIRPVPQGLLYLYGVQGVSDSIEEAMRIADLDMKGFLGGMMGTFRVLHMQEITAQEGRWLQEKMQKMKYLAAVRGIPKANTSGEDMGNKGMGGANLNPDSEGTLEELITAMADFEYVLEVLSTPVKYKTLMAWQAQTQKQMTEWNGQLQGQRSLSMNLSIPMMYATNTGTSQGWSKNYTDARTTSYSHGESYNTGYSQNLGQSLTQSLGEAYGLSHGTSMQQSTGKSYSTSQGLSHSLSQGTTQGLTRGETIGKSWGQSLGQTVGYSQGVSRGESAGFSISQSSGNSQGLSSGINNGVSMGRNISSSMGRSTSLGVSQGQSMNQSQNTSAGSSYAQSVGNSTNANWGSSSNLSHSAGRSQSAGYSTNEGVSIGNSASVGQNISASRGVSANRGASMNSGVSASVNSGMSTGSSQGMSTGQSSSLGASARVPLVGISGSVSSGHNSSESTSINNSSSFSQGYGASQSVGESVGVGMSSGQSIGQSTNQGSSVGASYGYSRSANAGSSESYSVGSGRSYSEGFGASYGQNSGISLSNSIGTGWGSSIGKSESVSTNQGTSAGSSYGESTGTSQSQNIGTNTSFSISQNRGSSISTSMSQSASQSLTQSESTSQSSSMSESVSQSQSEGYTESQSESTSESSSISNGVSDGESYSQSVSNSTGQSWGESNSVSSGKSYGTNEGTSKGTSMGTTGAYMTGTSGSMGLGPSIGYSKSYQWVDQEVKDLLELFEYQNERLKKALNGNGAFYTYVYIATEDMEALSTAQVAAKGTWQNEYARTNPLEVLDLSIAEQQHLLYHFSAFSSDVTREIVGGISQYKYATVLLPHEYVAYTHLPRISEGGIDTIVDDIPKFRVPAMMTGNIFMGTILNSERFTFKNQYRTYSDYRINIDELMHGVFTGQSRSGKTVAAMRFIKELANSRRTETGKRLRIVIMDPKQDWRGIARFVEPERFRFYSMGNTHFRPINLNPCKIPYGVEPQHWIDGIINIYCRAYGLLERGKQMLSDIFYELYKDAGVFDEEEGIKQFGEAGWKREVSRRSGKITFHKIYKNMAQKRDLLAGEKNRRAGNDTMDAYSRLLERLSCFGRQYSIEYRLFSAETDFDDPTAEGIGYGVDELIGEDDVTVFESFGLESTFANFIFGILTSGFYKVAKSFERGYLHPSQYETVLVIEEANKVLTGNDTAGTGGDNASLSGQSEFEEILDQSAGYGLFIFAITQKISMMPSSIVANCGLLFLGKISNQNDIETSVIMIGRDPKIQDKDVAKWLPKSPTGWFIIRSNRGYDFRDAEPVLVQIEPLNNATISNAELDMILTQREVTKELESIQKREAKAS